MRHTMLRPVAPLPEEGLLSLRAGADGALTAEYQGTVKAVTVRQAFPWTEPAQYLSLRDEKDEEFALVEDVRELEPASRAALETAMALAGFVLEVTRVEAVEEEIEMRHWRVTTRQGPRSFQTRLDDWPREVPGGGLLIRDVAGDLYHVREPESLDEKSQTLLWAFVD